jgi:Fe-S cluster assembly protein SufD
LSATAEIDTKPELEIYANDVKCSHGATTGQLDANSLFYLQSRGISAVEARALLIRAFAESILTSFDYAPMRNYLERRLHARFAGIADLDAQISKGVLS